nr:hypothetical protein [Campylobacter concisus]
MLAIGALFACGAETQMIEIKASDQPFGYASIGAAPNFGGYVGKQSKEVTIKNRQSLIKYAKMGGYVIYVDGLIDLSEGKIPQNGESEELDKFIRKISGDEFSSYAQFMQAYGASCLANLDGSQDPKLAALRKNLANEYKKLIVVPVASNTTIIGLGENSGIKGGSFLLKNVQNIAIRNMKIEDAFDPFPDIEKNDGFNAQYDGISIESSKNIWIDRCHFKDTVDPSHVHLAGGELTKWQAYDGLCDIKGDSKAITISHNIFENHDKTMLIGSKDSDGSSETRTITLAHNLFYNCAQRLPMARNSKVHAYNNFYDAKDGFYDQKYAIGVRFGSLIYAQNNYFAKGVNISYKCSNGAIFQSGNIDLSKKGNTCKKLTKPPFEPPYKFEPIKASNVQNEVNKNAGTGKLAVIK